MPVKIQLGDIRVDVIRRDIDNVHLSVHCPTGRVRVTPAASRFRCMELLTRCFCGEAKSAILATSRFYSFNEIFGLIILE
jgi:hypothetical protein